MQYIKFHARVCNKKVTFGRNLYIKFDELFIGIIINTINLIEFKIGIESDSQFGNLPFGMAIK